MYLMIIMIYNHNNTTCINFCMFDWSGENGDKSGKSQGKVREKSGNFDILCEWQPCY